MHFGCDQLSLFSLDSSGERGYWQYLAICNIPNLKKGNHQIFLTKFQVSIIFLSFYLLDCWRNLFSHCKTICCVSSVWEGLIGRMSSANIYINCPAVSFQRSGFIAEPQRGLHQPITKLINNPSHHFHTLCILRPRFLAVLSIKGASEKNAIFYFYSARANWPTHKISDFSEPPFMFFAYNFSNIWHMWSNPKINHKLLTVLYHLKKQWTFFDEKWAHNDHLLLNISNSLYFHS